MRIGIPRESRPGETLVGATAKTAAQLVALGYDVVVEAGAGAAADQPDTAYADAGVAISGAEAPLFATLPSRPQGSSTSSPHPGGSSAHRHPT